MRMDSFLCYENLDETRTVHHSSINTPKSFSYYADYKDGLALQTFLEHKDGKGGIVFSIDFLGI